MENPDPNPEEPKVVLPFRTDEVTREFSGSKYYLRGVTSILWLEEERASKPEIEMYESTVG